MTSTIAFIGKSGSGKTTLTRAFLKLLQKNFKDKTILLIDNDLTLELSDSFGIKTKNTIYGVKSGKHEYKTGIPEGMTKQEYIDWALEDIVLSVDENVDIIASWFVTPKDCHCPSTKLMRDSVTKLIERYDFVLIDCEYDLKYLNLLTDCMIDVALIISKADKNNIALASKISEGSKKYVSNGQMGVILNAVEDDNVPMDLIDSLELDLIGCIGKFDTVDNEDITNILEVLYTRMNLPQERS